MCWKKKSPFSLLIKVCDTFGARVHNNYLMVLSFEPFSRPPPPPEESFSLAVAEATQRAFAMRARKLLVPERGMLFKLWLLLLLVHPARVIFPRDIVVPSVNIVYWTARMASWTIAQPIFSLPQSQGRFSLPDSETFF